MNVNKEMDSLIIAINSYIDIRVIVSAYDTNQRSQISSTRGSCFSEVIETISEEISDVSLDDIEDSIVEGLGYLKDSLTTNEIPVTDLEEVKYTMSDILTENKRKLGKPITGAFYNALSRLYDIIESKR